MHAQPSDNAVESSASYDVLRSAPRCFPARNRGKAPRIYPVCEITSATCLLLVLQGRGSCLDSLTLRLYAQLSETTDGLQPRPRRQLSAFHPDPYQFTSIRFSKPSCVSVQYLHTYNNSTRRKHECPVSTNGIPIASVLSTNLFTFPCLPRRPPKDQNSIPSRQTPPRKTRDHASVSGNSVLYRNYCSGVLLQRTLTQAMDDSRQLTDRDSTTYIHTKVDSSVAFATAPEL